MVKFSLVLNKFRHFADFWRQMTSQIYLWHVEVFNLPVHISLEAAKKKLARVYYESCFLWFFIHCFADQNKRFTAFKVAHYTQHHSCPKVSTASGSIKGKGSWSSSSSSSDLVRQESLSLHSSADGEEAAPSRVETASLDEAQDKQLKSRKDKLFKAIMAGDIQLVRGTWFLHFDTIVYL